MDSAQQLILVVGLVATGVTFVLMRYPQTRRPQFRGLAGLSLPVSLMGALIMLAMFCGIVYIQGL